MYIYIYIFYIILLYKVDIQQLYTFVDVHKI